jgi:putative ATPase
VIYLCGSPKSNAAYCAINSALKAVREGVLLEIPQTICQQNRNYLYPHDFGGWVKQEYLSRPMKFVALKEIGYEAKMKKWFYELNQVSKKET